MRHLFRIVLLTAASLSLAVIPVSGQNRRTGNGGSSSSNSAPRSSSAGQSRSVATQNNQRRGEASVSRSQARPTNGQQARSGSNQPVRTGQQARPSNGQQARPNNNHQARPSSSNHQYNPSANGGRRPNAVHQNNGYERPSNNVGMRPAGGSAAPRVHPRMREPMPPPARPVHFWNHGPHYFGHRVTYLPSRYERHYYYGVPYYFCDGIWYRHYNSCYYVCRPPFGYVFSPAADLVLNACRFAYYVDTYYSYSVMNENAGIIMAQNAQIAANNALIAQQNSALNMNSQRARSAYETANSLGVVQSYASASTEYYYQDGVFYVKEADGRYSVIVPPAGALVSQLPDDYDTVVINGEEYFKVDDTLYRMTISDGYACFEVVGQLTGELANRYNMNLK